jgi:galactonate dehydratase
MTATRREMGATRGMLPELRTVPAAAVRQPSKRPWISPSTGSGAGFYKYALCMVISRIETFMVPPRWLFVRIETDDGLVGWGEASVEGRGETMRVAVDQLAEQLIGEDPSRIENLWQLMTKGSFYRGGVILASAVSGIDQALWDIAGKAHGVPVHTLLGGHVRDRVRVYGWIGGDDPSEVAEGVEARIAQGLTAVKMNAGGKTAHLSTSAELDAVVSRVSAARDALGPDRDFAIDFHGRFTAPNARRLIPLLEPFRPMFVEEPILPEFGHLFERLIESTPVPIATGERLFSRQEFLPVLQAGVAVVQPDLSHAGGISEVRRIASLADTFDAQLAPHCPLGPIALAACLQLGFATPNFLIQEHSMGIHYNTDGEVLDYVVDTSVFDFSTGNIERLTAPGLGIEVDEAAVREVDKRGHAWRSPIWRHDDGSFAEW